MASILCHDTPTTAPRSTFAGAGKWAGHWTGDNAANWQSFRDSTTAVLAANMWGMAMTGADICGFYDKDDEVKQPRKGPELKIADDSFRQLCNRWVWQTRMAW